MDIFGSGYVVRDHAGWEITAAGRKFLSALEAVTQDNQPVEAELSVAHDVEATEPRRGTLIVVGHRFKNRIRQQNDRLTETKIHDAFG